MKALLLAVTGAALASCAPNAANEDLAMAPTDATTCFRSSEVTNFRMEGSDTLFIQTRGYGYKLEVPANCVRPGASVIAVEPYAGVSSRICAGDEARVRSPDPIAPQTCIARVTGPVTKEESGLPVREPT